LIYRFFYFVTVVKFFKINQNKCASFVALVVSKKRRTII